MGPACFDVAGLETGKKIVIRNHGQKSWESGVDACSHSGLS